MAEQGPSILSLKIPNPILSPRPPAPPATPSAPQSVEHPDPDKSRAFFHGGHEGNGWLFPPEMPKYIGSEIKTERTPSLSPSACCSPCILWPSLSGEEELASSLRLAQNKTATCACISQVDRTTLALKKKKEKNLELFIFK